MRADSIQQAKQDIWAAVEQRSGVSAFKAGSPAISVGLTHPQAQAHSSASTRLNMSSYKALILAESADAARIAEDAIGHTECEVVIMPEMAKARVTKEWVQATRDPLEIGQQIRPSRANWVGTGGIFIKGGFQVSNRHVGGMSSRIGREIRQGSRRMGQIHALGEIDPQDAKHDVMLTKVDEGLDARLRWSWGLLSNVAGIRSVSHEEIGDPATVTGQTDGTQHGILWGTGLENLPVGYDDFTGWYSGLNVWLDPKGGSFSLPGYSGSSIMMPSDNHCTDLLFAGGPDAQGRDLTFSSDMRGAIEWAGGEAVLA